MNKKYLPFYESLKDDDKEFWLNCSKEELIDHIVSNIRNGETLLLRINKAIEFLEKYGLKVIVADKSHEQFEKNLALLNNAIDANDVKYFYIIEDSELSESLAQSVDEITMENIKKALDSMK